jgi:hypothetical protein
VVKKIRQSRKPITPTIYYVSIKPAEEENLFNITWQDEESKTQISFINRQNNPQKDLLTGWEKTSKHLEIGENLFDFLDGGSNTRYFSQVLDKAAGLKKKIQINLRTCEETADWPFELIAKNGEFLLFEHVHLVRRVLDRGIERDTAPVNDKIRLLFMACDYLDKDSGLNREKEEEAIKKITLTFPIEMEVEDSGALQGLQGRLEYKHYDIIHLTGHAGIGEDNNPIFYMKDSTGKIVKPGKLWDGALIENLPRLLFLSGCRSGQMQSIDGAANVESYAHLMVDKYRIPVVLGWGRKANDILAIYCAETFYQALGQGRSIPDAVQQARHRMFLEFDSKLKESRNQNKSTWPMLRLYCNGTPLHPIIKEVQGQNRKQESQQTADICLPYRRVKVLKKYFIGRRSQLQICMQALDYSNDDQVGVLLLGTGGIGKSCLAAKVCERFPDHAVIVLEGKLDEAGLERGLQKAFNDTGDKEELKKLKDKTDLKDKLADFCATGFKERNYILLLDAFDRNLEWSESGGPAHLPNEAAELLYTLLYYLPYSGKMSHLVITSRFSFTMAGHGGHLLEERLTKVWLTSLRELELDRKVRELKHIGNCKDSPLKRLLVNAGCGNPLLLEQIDRIAGRIPADDIARLEAEIRKTREDFIQELGLYKLYRQCSEPLKRILERLHIYPNPVSVYHIQKYETKITEFPQWKEVLQEAMNLGLVEYDQVNRTYRLTPLLKEELRKKTG